jgi:protein-arginine kinase activator protein McsA
MKCQLCKRNKAFFKAGFHDIVLYVCVDCAMSTQGLVLLGVINEQEGKDTLEARDKEEPEL